MAELRTPVLMAFDVLGLGCVAVDDLLYVAAYPPADTKTQIIRRERQCGGLTATALVAAARLGCRCAYAGALGEDGLSQFVLDTFAREGVDTGHLVRQADARPAAATIIVDGQSGSRNIFYDLSGASGASMDGPAAAVIASARVLLVDCFGVPGMIRAAQIARAAGAGVVADFERDTHPRLGELLALVDHLLLSHGFAARLTGESQPARALHAAAKHGAEAVVITCGEQGCYYLAADGEIAHQRAFRIQAVDTTGCGDVFHGAYAGALARGLPLLERIRFAAATAALKAMTRGGQAGIPTRPTVEEFLRQHA